MEKREGERKGERKIMPERERDIKRTLERKGERKRMTERERERKIIAESQRYIKRT